MEQKYKIIALFGKSGVGKDTLQKYLIKKIPNSQGIVSCTTRPKRDYEQDGKDYHFLTDGQFAIDVSNCNMLEATSFRGWFYGTRIDALDKNKINIGIFNLEGMKCLLEDNRLEILPIHIIVPDKIRLMRSLSREKNPDCKEICRRFLSDEKDFEEGLDFFSLIYDNSKQKITLDDLILSTNFIGQD